MASSAAGLILLSIAPGFSAILFAVALVGVGSAVFHPEASRIARMASGGRHGLAQSLFSVGGNAGSSMGPLLAAFVVLPRGQRSIGWFSLLAILAMALLAWVSVWYKARSTAGTRPRLARGMSAAASGRRVGFAMTILIALLFSKYFYLASLTNYYTFFLRQKSIRLNPLDSYSAINCSTSCRLRRCRTSTTCFSFMPLLHHQFRRLNRWFPLTLTAI
jgi:FSR family fosmidomycin resistance protein-like MFS transporter